MISFVGFFCNHSITLFLIQDQTNTDTITALGLLDFLLLIHFLNYRFQIRETPDYKIWQDTMDAEFGGGKFGDQRGAIRPRRGASNLLQHNTLRNF